MNFLMTSSYWPQWHQRSSEAVRGCFYIMFDFTYWCDYALYLGYDLTSNSIEATEAIIEARLILAWKFKLVNFWLFVYCTK